MRSFIVLDGVARTYRPGDLPAVDALSLRVEAGEILALLGPSGCGKTTTLRLIIGFERPDAGRIEIGDRTVADDGTFVPPEVRGIGMVFQDGALFPHLTVAANIAFGIRRLPKPERRYRTQHVLELIELEGLAERYPHELSGGQQQRVALARALAPGYPIVLLDEPLASLDADLRTQLASQLRHLLKETGRTAILVTHDQAEAFQMADRVGVLRHGRVEQIGTPDEIYRAPATRFVAAFIGDAEFLPGTVRTDGIHTELGVLPRETSVAPGADVDVLLRPEDVVLVADPDGEAVVVGRRFRGATALYSVRLGSGRHAHSCQSASLPLVVGNRVTVKAAPTRVFPR
jgi:iron(III) transport system ATP-binding protein